MTGILRYLEARDTVCMDLDKIGIISGNGEVRARRRPFVPFGMTGQKLVSDYPDKLPEKSVRKRKAVSRMQAESASLGWSTNGNDNRFRIDDKTNHVLIIQCQRNP